MTITENYKKLVKKDLEELDKLVLLLETKTKTLRKTTDEMMEAIKK